MTDKYKRMMKIGIPIDAVKHAMAKDNICKSIIDNFMNFADTTCSSCNVIPNNISKMQTDEENEESMKKYQKMLRMGLSKDMIRHKMRMDRVSNNIVTSICGTGDDVSSINSYRNKKKKKSGLISIYWEKMSKDAIDLNCNNVWSIIANKSKEGAASPYIDEEILHQMFQKPSSKRTLNSKNLKAPSTISAASQNEMAQILSNNRAQNICINLRVFKEFSIGELTSVINNLDSNHQIKGDKVLRLRALLPKQNESDEILQYKGDDKTLNDAELFFRKLLLVPRFDTKVKVIETIGLFEHRVEELMSSFYVLTTMCENVIKSEKLQYILEVVLNVGNVMNSGSRFGDAVGIKIGSLIKVTQTKSYDRKSTVLDYIVEMIIKEKGKDALEVKLDIPGCKSASCPQVNDMLSNFNSLIKSYEECQIEYTILKDEQRKKGFNALPTVLNRLESFIGRSKSSIIRLQTSKKDALAACRNLITYCGEKEAEAFATSVLTSLAVFINSIDESVSKYERLRVERKKIEKKICESKPSELVVQLNNKSVNPINSENIHCSREKDPRSVSVPSNDGMGNKVPLEEEWQQNSSVERTRPSHTGKAKEGEACSSTPDPTVDETEVYSLTQEPDPKQVLTEMLIRRVSIIVASDNSEKCSRTCSSSETNVSSSQKSQTKSPVAAVKKENTASMQKNIAEDTTARSDQEATNCHSVESNSTVDTRDDVEQDDREQTASSISSSVSSSMDQSEEPHGVNHHCNISETESNLIRGGIIHTSQKTVKTIHSNSSFHSENTQSSSARKTRFRRNSRPIGKKLLRNIINLGKDTKKHGATKSSEQQRTKSKQRKSANNKIRQNGSKQSFRPLILRPSWSLKS